MGVIKNLMVRIGVDVRAFREGMRSAASVTNETSNTVNKHSSGIRKAVANSFSATKTAIKEHLAAVSQTKEAYTVARQNSERLASKLQELQGVYDTVKNATVGMNLATPLEKQIKDAEESYHGFLNEAQKTKEALLKALSASPKKVNADEIGVLRKQLESCRKKASEAGFELAELKRVADAVGTSNIGYTSTVGLKQLESQIQSTENELNTAKTITGELGARLKSLGILPTVGRAIKNIGTTAAYAAGYGVGKLWKMLKNIGASAVHGIASLPSKLRNIGNSASSSCGGLGKMVRSIRNIGIASLGMRVASGMFGRMRSIISSYIYQNEELNASVTSLRNQMGEAMLPAINLVLAAMQKLMPVVNSVSNGINSILTSLFGDMLKTTSAIKKAADEANSLEVYGFDQITKASESSRSASASSTSSGSQSALVHKLTGWIQKLKAAFVAGDWKRLGQIVGEGINSIFDYINAIDVGAKFGSFVNNLMTTAYGVLSTVDFTGIGTSLGQMFTSAIQNVDWNQAGTTIGLALLALPSTLVGFALSTDWGALGQSIGELLKSALSTGTQWIQNTDWLQLGKNVADLIAGVDWSGLARNLFSFFGSALGAGVSFLWGSINGVVTSIKTYFGEKIEAAGGNVALGLLDGIVTGLGDIGTWVTDNITDPFVEGFTGLGNGVVEAIEEMINSIIGGINDLFGGWADVLSGLLPGTSLSDQLPTMQTVTLPRAARGTVVKGATNLTVGEDGTEAVVPLEKHTGWMDYLASQLSVKASGNGNGATSVVLQFILGNRMVTEYFIEDINQITHENGECPIRL